MNQVLLGDCLELMKDIPTGSVDMVLCDLPYGTTGCKWDVIIPFEPLWEQYERIIKDNGAIVLTCAQPFTSVLGASNIKLLKYSWVWEKVKATNFLHAKNMPMRGFEDVLVFYKSLPTYNPQDVIRVNKTVTNTGTKRRGGIKLNGDLSSISISGASNFKSHYNQEFEKYPRGFILTYDTDKISLHPTQKPVALFEYLIKTYTNEGELVLDNCAGSGTTAIACLNTNRNYICMEKNESYFKVIQDRIEEYEKKPKIKKQLF